MTSHNPESASFLSRSRKFDELARGLANEDNGKVEKKIAADKAKRIKKRKKK